MTPKRKGVRAWAVIYLDSKEIVGYQDYDKVPNDVLLRICRDKKHANQLSFLDCKVIQVEIRPVPKKILRGKNKGEAK